MQVRSSFLLTCFVSLGLGMACSDSSTPDAAPDDDGSSSGRGGSSGTPGDDGGPVRDGGASSSSGSTSSSGGADASLRPGDCKIVPPTTFANGPDLVPRRYGSQPTLRSVVVTPQGEPTIEDRLALRIDSATGIGSYDLAVPGAGNCYAEGAQCVFLHEDVDDTSAVRMYVAVGGRVRIDAQITADQSAGVIEYAELREAEVETRNVPFPAATLRESGRCLWIENAPFDTRRPHGCNPRAANACPSGEVCVRENAAGTDGTCHAATGSGTNGTPCTVDAEGGSNCNAEHMCSEDAPADRKCRRLCDLFAADNVCPTNTICGPFGYCEPPKNTAVNETVSIGESCVMNRFFCGQDGARGVCFNATDDAAQPLPEGPRCHGFQYSRAACGMKELAYVPIEGYEDRSLAVCVPKQ